MRSEKGNVETFFFNATIRILQNWALTHIGIYNLLKVIKELPLTMPSLAQRWHSHVNPGDRVVLGYVHKCQT